MWFVDIASGPVTGSHFQMIGLVLVEGTSCSCLPLAEVPGILTVIEVCGRCGGAVRVIACIEDQEAIDRILDHLRQKEQELPTQPLLVPPTRAPPGTLPLFAGKGAR